MPKKRPIKEPGGVLLIGLGMSAAALAEAIEELYPDAVSLTVLADEANRKIAASADEVWIYAPLGLRGFMALMRRISWRPTLLKQNQQICYKNHLRLTLTFS